MTHNGKRKVNGSLELRSHQPQGALHASLQHGEGQEEEVDTDQGGARTKQNVLQVWATLGQKQGNALTPQRDNNNGTKTQGKKKYQRTVNTKQNGRK